FSSAAHARHNLNWRTAEDDLRGSIERAAAPLNVRPAGLDIDGPHRPSEPVKAVRRAAAGHTLEPHPTLCQPQHVFVATPQLPPSLEEPHRSLPRSAGSRARQTPDGPQTLDGDNCSVGRRLD